MSTNKKFDAKQGLLMSDNFVLAFQTPVWPVHLTDKAKSFSKPYPLYKGSARLEGADEKTLYQQFIDKGFQPCVVNCVGIRMKELATGKLHTWLPEGGFPVVALVRYTEVGRPEVHVLTKAAPADVTTKYGWRRAPVRALGATDEERYSFAKETILATKPAIPQVEAEVDEQLVLTEDPFAA